MIYYANLLSPSMRRVWIEIRGYLPDRQLDGSPSMRRVWIEMEVNLFQICRVRSPSMRRVWIEMCDMPTTLSLPEKVTLHAEGVD